MQGDSGGETDEEDKDNTEDEMLEAERGRVLRKRSCDKLWVVRRQLD